ncbi:hypothetical protein U9M48_029767 [Paspalum notatum var. saurae]|uniref:Uncharacterized protein n=1 Tax=Paspalum notatum var. saurae TaxID=547442 RepID=A0AAQ3X1H4_PASNO
MGFLTINSLLAVYNSWGDAGSVAFVLLGDTALRDGRSRDNKIKAAVWALTTLLTAMFASRVAPLMPPAIGAVVWGMVVAAAAAGFWALFLHLNP